MKFLIHENLPRLGELIESIFSVAHGSPITPTIEIFSGRIPPPEQLLDTEVLLVRSVTRVDKTLLAKAPALKFVGTGTIGTEHIDVGALNERGIGFASAPGSNAISVGEYVLAAALELATQSKVELAGKRALVIGAGHTGTEAGQRLAALGMVVQYMDPEPVVTRVGKQFVDWSALAQADLVTCHVPLTKNGNWPTFHLFNAQRLAELKPGAILINASRGAVVDNQALYQRLLREPAALQVALDVWEGEPAIMSELLPQVQIATPHIAGHSAEGKLRGSILLAEAVRCFFAKALPALHVEQKLAELMADEPKSATVAINACPTQEEIAHLVRSVYRVKEDDQQFREVALSPEGFENMRKRYTQRRELSSQTLTVSGVGNSVWRLQLEQLGFNVSSPAPEAVE
ncbi:4-phosphoerythronate dehydrogenase [Aliidiomarina celeris]|uniref:4-phosphoerythronate dehydrogenase n=1 Tax=Aliidiomarina celeris TaxID=2249428 RepID=UPI000DE95A1D|nr:4-phosphoerythronate dehydrogenase [Aliidiomarina celeris]